MTVPLPAKGDGSRRRRREEGRRRGQRTLVRAIAVAALVAVVGGIAWAVVDIVVDDGSPPPPSSATTGDGDGAGDADEGPGPALLVLTDVEGVVYGVTVFQPETSAIVHVPPGTLVEVPSLGLTSLRDAASEGGVSLLQQSLENVLGLHFDAVATLDPLSLAALVPSPLAVTVADAVEERDASGRVAIVVPEGAYAVDADNALMFLSAVGAGTSLDRLVRHQSFWTAYLAGSDAPAPPLDAVAALAGARAQQRVLPVEAVAGVEGDDELYRVVEGDVAAMVDRLFPTAVESRIRVRILNGVGTPGIAQQVQPLLLDAGGRMTLSGNADRFDYAVTQVVYYDDSHRADAEALRDALGVGEVVKSLAELAVVDVTVVVGADFVAAHPRTGG